MGRERETRQRGLNVSGNNKRQRHRKRLRDTEGLIEKKKKQKNECREGLQI